MRRIRLRFQGFSGIQRSMFMCEPCTPIESLCDSINAQFGLCAPAAKLRLSIDGYELPRDLDTRLIREDDVITVSGVASSDISVSDRNQVAGCVRARGRKRRRRRSRCGSDGDRKFTGPQSAVNDDLPPLRTRKQTFLADRPESARKPGAPSEETTRGGLCKDGDAGKNGLVDVVNLLQSSGHIKFTEDKSGKITGARVVPSTAPRNVLPTEWNPHQRKLKAIRTREGGLEFQGGPDAVDSRGGEEAMPDPDFEETRRAIEENVRAFGPNCFAPRTLKRFHVASDDGSTEETELGYVDRYLAMPRILVNASEKGLEIERKTGSKTPFHLNKGDQVAFRQLKLTSWAPKLTDFSEVTLTRAAGTSGQLGPIFLHFLRAGGGAECSIALSQVADLRLVESCPSAKSSPSLAAAKRALRQKLGLAEPPVVVA